MPTDKEIIENLRDAGVKEKEARTILECIQAGKLKRAEMLIGANRKEQLARIHESQINIDRLDYLCNSIKKQAISNNKRMVQ